MEHPSYRHTRDTDYCKPRDCNDNTFVYRDETITLLKWSCKLAIFQDDLAAGFVGQPHIDMAADQRFHVVTGKYLYTHGWDGQQAIYEPGETIIIPRGTPFQIVNVNNEAGELIGTFNPGCRFQLVVDLNVAQRARMCEEGPDATLTLAEIEAIEANYCVYTVSIPNIVPFQGSVNMY